MPYSDSPLNLSVRQTPNVDGRRSAPGRIFGWILTMAGAGFTLFGADETRRLVTIGTWPTVPGRVESAHVSADTVGARRATKFGRQSPIVEDRFHVSYHYRVGGVEYVGDQVDRLPATRRNARADLRRYPSGTEVSVHYDPRRPTEAVLEARRPAQAVFTALAGLALLAGGRRLTRKKVSVTTRDASL
jgi:hypothetical protein